jgi:hypothetical protein
MQFMQTSTSFPEKLKFKFSTSAYCCKSIFRSRLSPETFGYTLMQFKVMITVPLSRVNLCPVIVARILHDLGIFNFSLSLSFSLS